MKGKEDRNNFLSTNGFLGMIEMLNVIKKRLRPEKGQVLVFSILLLPLVLGILALLVEMGNLYVHYQNLQSAADNAVLTLDGSTAKGVADKNNLKPDFVIRTYTYPNDDYSDDLNDKFFIKLEKDVPPIFIKVFGEQKFLLKTYAAASKSTEKLTPITKAEMDYIEPSVNPKWKLVTQ